MDIDIKHIMMVSTFSYEQEDMPFTEISNSDVPLQYMQQQKNLEVIHSYSNIYDLPTTLFRFFTVYCALDMALFKFVKLILAHEPIDVYNHGICIETFYIDDLVNSASLLLDKILASQMIENTYGNDSSNVVSGIIILVINKILLTDFINEIEKIFN